MAQRGRPRKNNKITNALESAAAVKNGLSNVLGLGYGVGGGNPFVPEISQTNTIFINLRWYLISNMRQVLSQAYVELGLIKTVVDVPVDDGFRNGVRIKSKQLAEEEIQKLQIAIEKDNDIGIYAQAQKWNRLFGGAGVITLTGENWEEPLDIENIQPNDIIGFRAVDMWELYGDRQNLENGEGNLEDIHSEFYSYYGKKIHKSRVHILKGLEAPSFIRPRLRGWGFSVLESILRPVNQYLKTEDLIFEVLDEFKIDYYKFKGLVNTLMSPQGEQLVQQRIKCTNAGKNFNNAVVLDSEDDWQQKELSFTGIAETLTSIRMGVACALRMPLTKIFGISASGFSSGQDDIENYNSMVEGEVRAKSRPGIVNMVKIRSQQLFGFIPDDISIDFEPLRILSAEQQENVKTQQFSRLMQAVSAGHMTEKEFKDACNKEELLCIQIDTSVEKLEPEPSDENIEAKKAPEGTINKTPQAKN
jgi:uncharacterized protein